MLFVKLENDVLDTCRLEFPNDFDNVVMFYCIIDKQYPLVKEKGWYLPRRQHSYMLET